MSAYRTHPRTCRALSGFTLFELLVVILIISLISALVMPRMAASLPGVQLKSTTRAVAASLRYARSRAVYESTPYIAIFDKTQNFLAVEPIATPLFAAESNAIRKILNMSELEKVYQFPAGIEFDVLNDNAADEDPDVFAIFFFPRGDSTGAKIVLQNLRRKRYTITVDMITGSVEIDRL
jgi:general secretion pathway protein H